MASRATRTVKRPTAAGPPALLLVCLCLGQPVQAAVVQASGGGVAVTPAVMSGWRKSIKDFFSSPNPDPASLSGVLSSMKQFDFNDPALSKDRAVSANLQLVKFSLEDAAESLIKEVPAVKAARPARIGGSSPEAAQARAVKLRVLNETVFKAYLASQASALQQEVENQSRLQQASLSQAASERVKATMERIAGALGSPKDVRAEGGSVVATDRPRLGSGVLPESWKLRPYVRDVKESPRTRFLIDEMHILMDARNLTVGESRRISNPKGTAEHLVRTVLELMAGQGFDEETVAEAMAESLKRKQWDHFGRPGISMVLQQVLDQAVNPANHARMVKLARDATAYTLALRHAGEGRIKDWLRRLSYNPYEDNWSSVAEVLVEMDRRLLEDPGPIPALDEKRVGLAARFVRIEPGEFMMGSPESEQGRQSNELQHLVRLTKGFEMQSVPVTQLQYFLVMGVNPSIIYKNGSNEGDYTEINGVPLHADHPVESSWIMGIEYMNKLSELADLKPAYLIERDADGLVTDVKINGPSIYETEGYRYPTEAEWEYAARAGTPPDYPFSFGYNEANELNDHAWLVHNSNLTLQVVASKKPNPWALYDMHGNIREWTQDGWPRYSDGSLYPSDPVNPVGHTDIRHPRVVRGGSWYNSHVNLRSASRLIKNMGQGNNDVGLRPVRSIP